MPDDLAEEIEAGAIAEVENEEAQVVLCAQRHRQALFIRGHPVEGVVARRDIGDGVTSYNVVVVVHEEDPHRACRATNGVGGHFRARNPARFYGRSRSAVGVGSCRDQAVGRRHLSSMSHDWHSVH